MHPSDLRQDPFEARGAIQHLIDLGYMAALPESAQGQLDMVRNETRFNLGMVLLTTGRPALAIPEFEALVHASPAESRYAIPLARAHMACLRPSGAVSTLQRYLQHEPDNPDARALLAAAMIALGQLEPATQIVERLELESGDRPASSQFLGDLYAALRRWDDAQRHFECALRHEPRASTIHLGLARIALGRENYEQAAEHSLDALDLQPATPEAHYLLGVALAWMNDLEHATQSFTMVLALQPGHLEAHRFLAALHRHQGRTQTAADHEAAADRLVHSQATSPEQLTVAAQESIRGPREWMAARPALPGGTHA